MKAIWNYNELKNKVTVIFSRYQRFVRSAWENKSPPCFSLILFMNLVDFKRVVSNSIAQALVGCLQLLNESLALVARMQSSYAELCQWTHGESQLCYSKRQDCSLTTILNMSASLYREAENVTGWNYSWCCPLSLAL